MAATVVRAEPPTLLEYTLGTDLLRWELAATGAGTRLTLRHTVKDREWIPKVAAGWHLCLDVAEKLLEGRSIPPIRGAAAVDFGWSELNDRYAQKFDIPNTGLPEHLTDEDETP
ncbi:SRPBCC domain-containing protein [Streptomyces dysideae]|uniref:SRPBCC domain-containing protein n=1 Tax=Streptomyces dysideae TaxID=909626 RepID=UPI00099E69A4|nr:SRPBCC domain-containing protein [Streptomyces dysideae]